MIYYFAPWAHEGKLGKAYNQHVALVPSDDDWVVITDGDVAFINNTWGQQIEDVIRLHPNAGLITCLTNRVGNPHQLYNQQFSDNADILHHRRIALQLARQAPNSITELKKPISGHFMVFRKSVWRMVGGFTEEKAFLGVDNDFSHRILMAGGKILLMTGLYVLHYYRLMEGKKSTKHLISQ